MTEPQQDAVSPAPTSASTVSSPGAAPDDRREDPPAPASAALAGGDAPATEAQREAQETVRSISRLEESN